MLLSIENNAKYQYRLMVLDKTEPTKKCRPHQPALSVSIWIRLVRAQIIKSSQKPVPNRR